MFKKKNKDKNKDSKNSKSGNYDKDSLNNDNIFFPITEDENNIDKSKTFNPSNSEFEVWRAIDNNNDKKNNKDEKLVLAEYLEKSKKSGNKNSEDLLKNKKVVIKPGKQQGINVIEDYFDKDTQQEIPNNNIDEDYSDNSDQEIYQKIHNQRENENDDDDDEEEKRFSQIRNKSRSKKVINNKIIENDDNDKNEYPDFTAECKFYGENKERYHVKIIIDSNFNLMFLPEMKNNFKAYNYNYYQFPLLSIKNYITTKKKRKYVVDIILKDYRSFSFKLMAEDFTKFNEIIQEFGKPNQNIKYFRYAYNYYNEYSKKEKDENYIDGWTIYEDEDEFKYQDLDFENTFRIVDNSTFKFCSTYPKKIVVPISMDDEEIKKCGNYRTKERFPALTYRYKKNGKCIWRSSQTKSGIKGKTNQDVVLLTKIAEGSKKLIVFDARPLLNAWANKLKGAGYEDVSQYPQINMELLFCGIPNIHAVRGSCHKVYSTLCFKNETENKNTKAKNNMDSGNWYDSIIILIKGAFQISEAIKNDNTVLIHCSDGWDRTTQLSCTSQLILEKRYRTIDGFICLIEKDWLTFGHQFRYRCGMYCPGDSPSNVASENQKSPVFIQWLDAVYQIMQQNITKFEYNTDLLYFLASEMFTGKYGTFLFNNELEREKYKAREKTVSIWTYVKENEFRFINPIYNPDDNLPFIMNYKRVQLWNKYFFRFEEGDNCYDEKISKVFQDIKNTVSKDKKIINDLVSFINKKCPDADISGLTEECQNLIRRKSKVIKKK